MKLPNFIHALVFPFCWRLENNFHCQLPFAWVAVQGALIFNLEKLLSMAYICSDGYICREKALTTF